MDIGQRVREVREDLGMQRTVLARRVGVAENTIYRIETGRRTPSVELLEKIARELRTEPAEFLREPVPLSEASGTGQPETGPSGRSTTRSGSSAEGRLAIRRMWEDIEASLSLDEIVAISKGMEDGRIDVREDLADRAQELLLELEKASKR